MEQNRRSDARIDRRAHRRGGRRDADEKPWYRRHHLWLAIASMAFVGWRRIVGRRRSA